MAHLLRPSALVPRGFAVDSAIVEGRVTVITVHSTSKVSGCPGCGAVSQRVHSRYRRILGDLPLSGHPVRLSVWARRFRCDAVLCGRRIFAERFADDVLAPWARRTARLDALVHHLGLALGGRPAASFAQRLMLPVSNDTLLRLVRRRGSPAFAPPIVIGIDDWAWRRNQRYGTLICDLERRRLIRLLPDREVATAQAWLSSQPQIAVVARDRGGGYALAVARALPNAVQVADRWHLMENASQAFLGAVRKSMRQIRQALGAATINPALLTAAERIQYEGYLRREDTNSAILAQAKAGAPIKEIVRRTGYSRGLVRRVLRGQHPRSPARPCADRRPPQRSRFRSPPGCRPRPRAAPRRRCWPPRPARLPGRWRSSQSRHCASGCGCDTTRRTSSSRPLRESSCCEMRRTTSPQIETSCSASASKVCVTTPSVVFSTGTTPRSMLPPLHRREHLGDRAEARELRELAELPARRLVREGPLRTEVAHAQHPLERARGGDDLAEDRRDPLAREGARIARDQLLEDLSLAGGLVLRAPGRGLDPSDRLHEAGAFVELLEDAAIDGVDARAQPREIGRRVARHRCGAPLSGLGHVPSIANEAGGGPPREGAVLRPAAEKSANPLKRLAQGSGGPRAVQTRTR